MSWYSQRSNFFTSNVVPREEHLHGWEGALTVSNPSDGGGHAEIVFTVKGVGCAVRVSSTCSRSMREQQQCGITLCDQLHARERRVGRGARGTIGDEWNDLKVNVTVMAPGLCG